MANTPKNPLGVIHAVLSHDTVKPILGTLSTSDLDVLSRHLANGTLMKGLTPLADNPDKQAALASMPPDLAGVLSKLADTHLDDVSDHLRRLGRDGNDALVCGC